MRTPHSRRVLAVCLAVSLCWTSGVGAGDLNAEADSMMSRMNMVGNVTQPGAFRGQAMNTFSGGSMMMRAPNKHYQLFAFDPPSFKGSCSGIDVNLGSFSAISSDAVRDMLQKITSAVPGLAFQMAIDAISPMFGGNMKEFMKKADALTQQSLSSCELATSLVGTIQDQAGYTAETGCRSIASFIGNFADDVAGWRDKCKGDGKKEVLDAGKASADTAAQERAPFSGNLTWAALKKGEGAQLSNDERELIMSVVGTMIYSETGVLLLPVLPTVTSTKQLLYGNEAGTSPAGDTVTVRVLKCSNYDTCDRVSEGEYQFKPFNRRVRTIMQSIVDHINERKPFGTNSEEVGFVNMVSEPVYRMLSIATYTDDKSVANSLIGRYADVIGAEYAYTFIEFYMRDGVNRLNLDSSLARHQVEHLRELQRNARSVLHALAAEKQVGYAKIGTLDSMNNAIEDLGRKLRANSPSNTLSVLGRAMPYLN